MRQAKKSSPHLHQLVQKCVLVDFVFADFFFNQDAGGGEFVQVFACGVAGNAQFFAQEFVFCVEVVKKMVEQLLRIQFGAAFFDKGGGFVHRFYECVDKPQRKLRHLAHALNHKEQVLFEFSEVALHFVQKAVIFGAVLVDVFAQVQNRKVDFFCERQVQNVQHAPRPTVPVVKRMYRLKLKVNHRHFYDGVGIFQVGHIDVPLKV